MASNLDINREILKDFVIYTECRFREALRAIRTATSHKRKWMEQALFKELSFVLTYIGMAAAIGRPAKIPFIIGLLARDIGMLELDREGIMFTAELQDLLDAGPFCPVPSSYLHPWWLGDAAPRPNQILNANNLQMMMNHYYQNENMFSAYVSSLHTCPSATTWTNHAEQALLAVPHRIRQQIGNVQLALEQKLVLSRRRASGFHQLWEAALLKESEDDSIANSAAAATPRTAAGAAAATSQAADQMAESSVKGGKEPKARRPVRKVAKTDRAKIPKPLSNAELAEIFREHSARELHRSQQGAATKWTWGVDLTETDISRMVRAADNGFQIPHSDYDESLSMGTMDGVSSIAEDLYSEESLPHTTISQTAIPDLAPNDIPTHFTIFPLRRPRSAVPEGFEPLNVVPQLSPNPEHHAPPSVKQPIDVSELLELAGAALQDWENDTSPIHVPADGAAAASADSDLIELATAALQEHSELLELADAALEEQDSQSRMKIDNAAPADSTTRSFPGDALFKDTDSAAQGIELELLGLAEFALNSNPSLHSSAADSTPSASPLESGQKDSEMLELADLALRSLPESSYPQAADIELADEEMAILDEFDLEGNKDGNTFAVSGPWTAGHFPRAPSDTGPESDEED